MSSAQLGGPVLLKQGYMQRKTFMGWRRQYFRLLQDSLFAFSTHESKTPLDEIELMAGNVEDASWEVKKANSLKIETERGVKIMLICETSLEHKRWFDALYYATTVSRLAEYCSPLSGGWLNYLEGDLWVKRWFLIRDSFLLCYNSREDVTPTTTNGKPINRRFVLPLRGLILAYHKTVKPHSFSLQVMQGGEVSHEFIFAADSEPIMNVWMEVLYVSTGKELPGFDEDDDKAALELDAKLDDLTAGDTPAPTRAHHEYIKGKGLTASKGGGTASVGGSEFHHVDHGVTLDPEEEHHAPQTNQSFGIGGLSIGGGGLDTNANSIPGALPATQPGGLSFPFLNSEASTEQKKESGGCAQQ